MDRKHREHNRDMGRKMGRQLTCNRNIDEHNGTQPCTPHIALKIRTQASAATEL